MFAHPSRSDAWKRFNPDWNARLVGIECWNRKTDGWAPSQDAWRLLRVSRAVPFAGQDFHDARQFFPLSTVLQVEEPIIETTVLACLRLVRCRSTAFGFPIERFAVGLGAGALRCAEFARRRAAFLYRNLLSRTCAHGP